MRTVTHFSCIPLAQHKGRAFMLYYRAAVAALGRSLLVILPWSACQTIAREGPDHGT